MNALPRGWSRCVVEDLVEETIGGVWGSEVGTAEIDVDVVRVTEMKRHGRLDTSTAARRSIKTSQYTKRALRDGDLLLEKSGGGPNSPVGRVGVVARIDRPAVCSNFMQLIRPNPAVSAPRFLLWQLVNAHTSGRTAALQTATTNIRNLKMADYWALELQLPPLAEQQRIVAAIEEAFSKLDAGEAGLRRVRQLLKRMRESVLAAAVTGSLVRQDDPDTLNASPCDQTFIDSAEPVGLPAIPPSWKWAPLREIGRLINGDRGMNYPSKADLVATGIPFVNAGHLQGGRISLDSMNYISAAHAARLGGATVEPGDILYCLRGSLGKAAVATSAGAKLASSLLVIRPIPGVDPEYLYTFLVSPIGRAEIKRYDNGSAQPNLSAASLGKFLVPLPPFEEQLRIAAAVERQLSYLDSCERTVDAGVARAGALRRAVLKSAFEGRLVPQDPSDEPASVMLDRLRADRGSDVKSSGRRGRKSIGAS